jgi:hypothetical protein
MDVSSSLTRLNASLSAPGDALTSGMVQDRNTGGSLPASKATIEAGNRELWPKRLVTRAGLG